MFLDIVLQDGEGKCNFSFENFYEYMSIDVVMTETNHFAVWFKTENY